MFDKLKKLINGDFSTNKESSIFEEAESIVNEKTYSFKVAGISNYYNNLEKIIRSLLNQGILEKFDGYTNKEIIEYDAGMTIFEHQFIKGAKLEPYSYKEKDAIKILLPDYNDKWYEIGSVPKKDLNQVIELLNKDKITNIEFVITGGEAKYINDDVDKPYIVEKEYDYGILIYITYID